MKIYSFVLCFFVVTVAGGQELESLLGFEHYNNPEILVVTNRLQTNADSLAFYNQVDTNNAIRAFMVTYSDSAFAIVPSTIKGYIRAHDYPGADYVVFVHGDGKTFLHAAVRGLDIQNTYGVQVIVFAWPSRRDDGAVISNFTSSLDNLKVSSGHFDALIDSVDQIRSSYLENNSSAAFTLFLHSLGNEYLPQFVEGSGYLKSHQPFDNLVINAAAVNSKDHAAWVEKLNIQKQIYINSNAKDVNLNGLRIISAYGYLVGELLLEPVAENAVYVNFTDAIGFKLPPGRSHTYYIGEHVSESPNVRNYYYELFHGRQPNLNNKCMFKKRGDAFGWDFIY